MSAGLSKSMNQADALTVRVFVALTPITAVYFHVCRGEISLAFSGGGLGNHRCYNTEVQSVKKGPAFPGENVFARRSSKE